MNKGVVIFAHNSKEVDYALMSVLAGTFASLHLRVPVSLITDPYTISWMEQSGIYDLAVKTFDQIISIDFSKSANHRRIIKDEKTVIVPFNNGSRISIWELTPYDRTLMIDSDFIILGNTLENFWEVDQSVLVSSSVKDIIGDRVGILDKWVSSTGIPLRWATTVMFTKNEESLRFFNIVKDVKENWKIYADLYNFDPTVYRNDISFSIASHLQTKGVGQEYFLPPILTAQLSDTVKLQSTSKASVTCKSLSGDVITAVNGLDLHVMNKYNLTSIALGFLTS